MTKKEDLQKFTEQLLRENNLNFSVSAIFKKNDDLEMLYYELLDYLDENSKASELVPKIEMYYQNI